MIGEIDTKPIETVQAALSIFGSKGDQKKYRPTGSDNDSRKELEDLTKDIANLKVQLEAKDAAYMQAILRGEHYQKLTGELSLLLKNCEIEKDGYLDERTRLIDLELKVKEMADQLLETAKVREKLSHVLSELEVTKGELLKKEKELAAARDLQFKAIVQAEQMKTAANTEKEKKEELQRQVQELNEVISMSKYAEAGADIAILSDKDLEIELAKQAAAEAQKQLEGMREQMEQMKDLEKQLLAKSVIADTLEEELNQAKQILISAEEFASCATKDLNRLQADMRIKERKNKDLSIYIEALEMELNQLKGDLRNAKEEIARSLTRQEIDKEAGQVRKENGKLKREDIVGDETGNLADLNSSRDIELSQIDKSRTKTEEQKDGNGQGHITISMKIYESLIKEAEKANQVPLSIVEVGKQYEIEQLKRELELATVKIGELRNRTEQAVRRAESAEKAKATLEDHIRRHREKRQKKRAAMAALREESTLTPKELSPFTSGYDETPPTVQPLGKVLNLKY